MRETAQKLGGGGGGRPESAQAGGRRLDLLPQALAGGCGPGGTGGEVLRLLALDVGNRRIGMAVSDPMGILASPRGYIERRGMKADVEAVMRKARELEAESVLVGMPFTLKGKEGSSGGDGG